MGPDPELLLAAVGSPPRAWQPVEGGYTRSRAWRVSTEHGPVFVKEADEEASLAMLRREALVYRGVEGSFLPSYVGFADSGERALLAIELLENAHWPPPYPDDVSRLFEALDQAADTAPPAGLPAHGSREPRWPRIAADPRPFLGLGPYTRAWLEASVDALVAAEEQADFTGSHLVHNDVYSANVAFTTRGAVLVDWGAAVRGSRWIDVAFGLLSVRVEGGSLPKLAFADEAAFAAAIAGHFAVEASAPLPDWAEPGSTLREDMAGDLVHALRWAAELLGLAPLP